MSQRKAIDDVLAGEPVCHKGELMDPPGYVPDLTLPPPNIASMLAESWFMSSDDPYRSAPSNDIGTKTAHGDATKSMF